MKADANLDVWKIPESICQAPLGSFSAPLCMALASVLLAEGQATQPSC